MSVTTPLTKIAPATSRGYWQIKIYDTAGRLVDLPKADIQSVQTVVDSVNGGAVSGTITFRRNFNNIGALGYGYSVQLWVWGPNETRPTDPWWSGWIQNFDQDQLYTTGQVVVYMLGDCRLLDRAVVTEQVNPGTNGNPELDAADYIGHLMSTYKPPDWKSSIIPASMFSMFPVQFTGTVLSQCIDTVVKQALDSNNNFFTWFVRTNAELERRLVVQVDQNPNIVSGATFVHLFANADFDQYSVTNKNDQLANVVTIIGMQDPITGQTAIGSVENVQSIDQYGPWENVQSIPYLANNEACQAYAAAYIKQFGFTLTPSTFRLLQPNSKLLAGQWVQLWEAPATADTPASVKQQRLASVEVDIDGDRLTMTPTTTANLPLLDKAIYEVGQHTNLRTAISTLALPQNTQTLYIRSGGYVIATSSNPAEVALAPVDAIFPSGEVQIPEFNGLVADSSTGASGDGHYIFAVTSSGTWVASQTAFLPSTQALQTIVEVTVIDGVPFINDLRTLNVTTDAVNQAILSQAGEDGSTIATDAVTTRALASNPDPTTPPQLPNGPFAGNVTTNTNAAGVGYQLDGYLSLPSGFAAWLAAVEFGAVPSGTALTSAITSVVDVSTPIDSSWTSEQPIHVKPLLTVGAGTVWDVYAWFSDQSGGTSTPTKVYTTPTNNAQDFSAVAMSAQLIADGPTIESFGVLSVAGIGGASYNVEADFTTHENAVSNPEVIQIDCVIVGESDKSVTVVNTIQPNNDGSYTTTWQLPASQQTYVIGICYVDGHGNISAVASIAPIDPQGIPGDVIVGGSISSTQIAPGSITTPLLAAAAVQTENLAANAVTATIIEANTIVAEHISATNPPIALDDFIVPGPGSDQTASSPLIIYQINLSIPDDVYFVAVDWSFLGTNCAASIGSPQGGNQRDGYTGTGQCEATAHWDAVIEGPNKIQLNFGFVGTLNADIDTKQYGFCRVILVQNSKLRLLGSNLITPLPGWRLPPGVGNPI